MPRRYVGIPTVSYGKSPCAAEMGSRGVCTGGTRSSSRIRRRFVCVRYLGRVVQATYTDGSTVIYQYDAGAGSIAVTVGGVPATITSISNTRIVFTAPSAAGIRPDAIGTGGWSERHDGQVYRVCLQQTWTGTGMYSMPSALSVAMSRTARLACGLVAFAHAG